MPKSLHLPKTTRQLLREELQSAGPPPPMSGQVQKLSGHTSGFFVSWMSRLQGQGHFITVALPNKPEAFSQLSQHLFHVLMVPFVA